MIAGLGVGFIEDIAHPVNPRQTTVNTNQTRITARKRTPRLRNVCVTL